MEEMMQRRTDRAADVLALGFGTTVLMWTAGYVMRQPDVGAPNWMLAATLLLCLLVGGWLTGRLTGGGWRKGAMAGVIVAALNLLIVGGTVGSGEEMTAWWALAWGPGTLVVTGVIMALAAMVGGRYVETTDRSGERVVEEELRRGINWTGWFALVGVAATGLLLVAGGLVTGRAAGLAVPDWPRSFGYNMFLYPLARMTGNIYYEHTHRLVGALVGLTTIALAVHLWMAWTRRWWLWAAGTLAAVVGLGVFSLIAMRMGVGDAVPFVWAGGTVALVVATGGIPTARRHGWACLAGLAVIAVIAQGVMGGYRVSLAETGDGVEYAAAEHETGLSVVLRVAHGVFGQLFFALMVGLAVAASGVWRRAKGAVASATRSTEQALAVMLVLALVGQLVLGALVRHTQMQPLGHIAAATLVALLAVAVGVRMWGLYGRALPTLRWMGVVLVVLVVMQVVLGFGALLGTGLWPSVESASPMRLLLTTAHQINGAALLGVATAVMALSFRVFGVANEWAMDTAEPQTWRAPVR